jgi:nucleoside-diphosphate-sugar epimerase
MHILVVGGSGYLGGLVLPTLAQQHTLRIFDMRPPANAAWEYIAGNSGDLAALSHAAAGMDALLYMAMGNKNYSIPESFTTNLDTNIKGVYLALFAAQQAGITHAVYTSSMSVYANLDVRYFPDEEIPPDASDLYGFTKRMGEEVCRNATRAWGMSANALRLCFPVSDEQWQAETRLGAPTLATSAGDVARALLAALECRAGFQAFMISGDYEQKLMNLSKARRLLGWAPLARPAE